MMMCLMATIAMAQTGQKHLLKVTVQPENQLQMMIGTYNNSFASYHTGDTIYAVAGEGIYIHPQAKATNYGTYVFKQCLENGNEITLGGSFANGFKYIMPDYDVDMELTLEYVATPPTEQPAVNGWYPETGTLVMDYENTYYPSNFNYNEDREKVLRLIRGGSGYTSVSMYGWGYDFPNMTCLDYSRTDVTVLYGYTNQHKDDRIIEAIKHISDLVLPATMKTIYSFAFGGSKVQTLTCYAMTPPTFYMQTYWDEESQQSKTFLPFTGTPDIVVRVPADAVPLYQKADYWKDMTILPIDEDNVSLTVNMMETPDDKTLAFFKNMHLDLTNQRTGIVRSMLVGNRNSYEFRYLPTNTVYDLALHSTKGGTVASIGNIFVGEEDQSVTFGTLKLPRTLNLSLTADGQTVDGNRYSARWLNDEGSYIGQGLSVDNVFEGQTLRLVLSLERDLAMKYAEPDTISYTIDATNNNLTVALQPLATTDVTFTVSSNLNNRPVEGATVSITQLLSSGDKGQTVVLTTDANGQAKGTVVQTFSDIIVNSDAYGSKTFIANLNDSTSFNTVLTKANGTVININWTYQSATYSEETAQVTQGYSDMNTMRLGFYNYSSYESITDYVDQAPRYILYESLPEGTSVQVTATSLNDKVSTVYGYGQVDANGQVNVNLAVVQRPTLHVSYTLCEGHNPALILFRTGNDNAITKEVFGTTRATIDFENLPSGTYDVVAMTKGEGYDAVYNRQQLQKLKAGSDYVIKTINMTDGQNQRLNIPTIPMTTGSVTSNLATNRAYFKQSQVSVGEYATVSVQAAFQYLMTVEPKNISLVFQVPQGCNYVNGSALKGKNAIRNAQYDTGTRRLTIPWDDIATDSIIRFCILPSRSGEIRPAASLVYTLDGEEHIDPLATSTLNVVSAVINVPDVINTPRFKVSGKSAMSIDASYSRQNASGKALAGYSLPRYEDIVHYNVAIMDGNVQIGSAATNSKGEWDAWVTLLEPTNLSRHTIWAKVERNRTIVETEKKDVVYDANAVVPKTLKMSFFNHHPAHVVPCEIVFDYINDKATPSHYGYSNEVGYNTDFTFEVDLSTNDTTKVYAVALFVHTMGPAAEERIVMCHYNKRKDRWIAYSKFNTESLPYDVYVEPYYYRDDTGSRQETDNAYNVFDEIYNMNNSTANELLDRFTQLIDQGYQAAVTNNASLAPNPDELNSVMQQIFHSITGTDYEGNADATDGNIDALLASIDAVQNPMDSIHTMFENIGEMNQLGNLVEGIITREATGLTHEGLLAEGYQATKLDDGTTIYVLVHEKGGWTYVDFKKNLVMEIPADNALARMLDVKSYSSAQEWFDTAVEFISLTAQDFVDVVGQVSDALSIAIDAIDMFIDSKVANQKDFLDMIEWNNKNLGWVERGFANLRLKFAYDSMTKAITAAQKLKDSLTKFKIGDGVGTLMSLYSLVKNYSQFKSQDVALWDLMESCPTSNCDDLDVSLALRSDIRSFLGWLLPYQTTTLLADVTAVTAGLYSLVAVPADPTKVTGLSLFLSIAKLALSYAATKIYDQRYADALEVFQYRRKEIVCYRCELHDDCPNGCEARNDCPKCKGKECRDWPKGPKGPKGPGTTGELDPSGYVYEGVPSNRVEGATVTVYFKETGKNMYGDPIEQAVMWNAEDFDQLNPQTTDLNGEYGWMVPTGEWQVKYEKEGYHTAYSEWLPVPPPQLDVNQELRQYSQPTVSDVRASQDGVQITFDKYMRPETLTTDNISVVQGGNAIDGTIELMNREETDGIAYASRVRFVPATALPVGQNLVLTVSSAVESYAKVAMGNIFTQDFEIVEAVSALEADSLVNVVYDNDYQLFVTAQPAAAAAGKKVRVNLLSDVVASISTTELTLNSSGQAVLDITGEAHGTTAIELTMADDENIKTLVVVNVKDESDFLCPMPTANYLSGTQLYYGSVVELSCELDDAIIYYSLDGTCPCSTGSESVKRYTEPITVTGDMQLKAVAMAKGYTDSKIMEWNYTLYTNSTSVHLSKGWNWFSHAAAADLPQSNLGSDTDYALDTDGATTTLLKPATAYKVHNTKTHDATIEGYAYNARQYTAALGAGWNWIAYPLTQNQRTDMALTYAQPQDGDVIVGENGFNVYTSSYYGGGQWQGTLPQMETGKAYRYKTTATRMLAINTMPEASTDPLPVFEAYRWYDRHGQPDRMPVIAGLKDESDSQPYRANERYQVMAFAGDECRGNGYWVQVGYNYYLFLNILGTEGEDIRFVIHDTSTDIYYEAVEKLTFTGDIIGTVNDRQWLHIGDETQSVNGVTISRHRKGTTYSVDGVRQKDDAALRKGVYIVDGQKVVK